MRRIGRYISLAGAEESGGNQGADGRVVAETLLAA
jgi:hypothetical protein